MANINYTFRVAVPGSNPVVVGNKRLTTKNLSRMFLGMGQGTRTGLGNTTITTETGLVAASGTVTIASGSGTVSITINGVAFSATWTTSDTATAAAFVTAINTSANALVAGMVTASSLAGVVSITTVNPGLMGNAQTLAAAGTGMTASGARLTGGTATSTVFHF